MSRAFSRSICSSNELLGTFIEGSRANGGLLRQRVLAPANEGQRFGSGLPSISKSHQFNRTQAHNAGFAPEHVTKEPGYSLSIDLKIKTVADSMTARYFRETTDFSD